MMIKRVKKRDNWRTTTLGHMNLERRVFDLFELPYVGTRITLLVGKNTVTEGCVSGEASVRPCVTDVSVMCRVVERKLLEFIGPHGTKECIILRKSQQGFPVFL